MLRRYPSLRTFRSAFISPNPGTFSDGDECCICLDPYNEESHQAVGITSNSDCKHVFGRQCLEAYLDSTNPGRNTCPVCRRKWYTRRIANPVTPRDTNTAQILAPFNQLRVHTRESSESGTFQRHSPGEYLYAMDNVTIGRHVEQLVYNMESIETLEATATQLDQEVRVRLRQIQARIRAFLDRNDEAADDFSSPAVGSSRPRGVPQTTTEPRFSPDPLVTGLDNGQTPYSLLGVALRNSTLLLSEIQVPRDQIPQHPNDSQSSANPVPDNMEQTSTLTRTAGGQFRSTVLTPRDDSFPSSLQRIGTGVIPRSEVHLYRRQSDHVGLSRSSNDFQSYQSINARGMEERLQAHWNGGSEDDETQYIRPLLNHHLRQSQVIDSEDALSPLLFAGTAADQAMNRHTNNRVPLRSNNYAAERSHTISRRIPRLRRTNNTLGFAYDSHPIGAPPQSILAASMTERASNLRIQTMPNSLQGGLSRMMNISGLCDMMARSRAR